MKNARHIAETDCHIQHASQIEGFLSVKEGRMLYELAAESQHPIVEVGSWKGRSTGFLALGSKAGLGVPVYAVDPHTGSAEHRQMFGEVNTFAQFQSNMARLGVLGNPVQTIRQSSLDAAREFSGPLGLLFIDGAHDLHSILQDLDAWSPFLVEGSTIALHDTVGYGDKGPKTAAIEKVVWSGQFKEPNLVGSLLSATRTECFSAVDLLKNALMRGQLEIADVIRSAHNKHIAPIRRRLREVF